MKIEEKARWRELSDLGQSVRAFDGWSEGGGDSMAWNLREINARRQALEMRDPSARRREARG